MDEDMPAEAGGARAQAALHFVQRDAEQGLLVAPKARWIPGPLLLLLLLQIGVFPLQAPHHDGALGYQFAATSSVPPAAPRPTSAG